MKNPFSVTSEEYTLLEEKFENLSRCQSWELLKKNNKNNHTNDFDDVMQEMRMYILVAGAYYKRQVYIESCLELASRYAKDRFMKNVIGELGELWENRKRHGVDRITRTLVPPRKRPSKKQPLRFDSKFKVYCKAITWNRLKMLGKNITKEKTIRTGLVSLSEFDYLVSD
jgi:hypothetical protein